MTEKESKFVETKMNFQAPVSGAAGKVEGNQIININNNYGTAHSQSGHDSEAELNAAKTPVKDNNDTEPSLKIEQKKGGNYEMTFVFSGTLSEDDEIEFNGKKTKIKALLKH